MNAKIRFFSKGILNTNNILNFSSNDNKTIKNRNKAIPHLSKKIVISPNLQTYLSKIEIKWPPDQKRFVDIDFEEEAKNYVFPRKIWEEKKNDCYHLLKFFKFIIRMRRETPELWDK